MNCVPQVVLIALSRAVMRGLGGARPGAIVLGILAISTTVTSCDSPARNPQLANGWVTNCAGPAFGRFSQDGDAGPGPDRPVFRINDQLVLAVPKKNWPSSIGIDREPRECNKISDLPPAPFLYFVIWGDWSAGYKPEDVPIVGGNKQFQTDAVTVRIEPEIPSKLSVEEQQRVDQTVKEMQQSDSDGTQQIGDLTCFIPKSPGRTDCFGHRSKADLDVTRLHYHRYPSTSFVLIQADYASSRYGRIHVNWKAWTSNVSHAMDIDAAVWNLLADWNLLNNTDAPAGCLLDRASSKCNAAGHGYMHYARRRRRGTAVDGNFRVDSRGQYVTRISHPKNSLERA